MMGTKQRGLTRAISFSNFTGSYMQQAIDTVGAESTLANQDNALQRIADAHNVSPSQAAPA